MPERRTVALVTLGCARNEVDSEELAGRLEADGWQLVERDGPVPSVDSSVDMDGELLVVTRVGPSPLPGDPRACAYLEPARTSA